MAIDYGELYRKRAQARKELKQACSGIDERSGIYFLLRKDAEGVKYAYIGKAVNLMERMISHLIGYQQRIDISLKNRGFYSLDNPYGWELNVVHCAENDLDKWEQVCIRQYANAGYSMYNIESGGTKGKTIIGERKPPKSYRDGLRQGRRTLAREIKHIIDTHLDIALKKPSKISEKALDKFWKLLESEDN